MEPKKVYFRNKSQFKDDENAALAAICKKENLKENQLVAQHSEKQFRWSLAETSKDFPFGLHTVAKSESLQDAKKSAMKHFDTFEGNIKRVESEEDEEHFVFTKVRQ